MTGVRCCLGFRTCCQSVACRRGPALQSLKSGPHRRCHTPCEWQANSRWQRGTRVLDVHLNPCSLTPCPAPRRTRAACPRVVLASHRQNQPRPIAPTRSVPPEHVAAPAALTSATVRASRNRDTQRHQRIISTSTAHNTLSSCYKRHYRPPLDHLGVRAWAHLSDAAVADDCRNETLGDVAGGVPRPLRSAARVVKDVRDDARGPVDCIENPVDGSSTYIGLPTDDSGSVLAKECCTCCGRGNGVRRQRQVVGVVPAPSRHRLVGVPHQESRRRGGSVRVRVPTPSRSTSIEYKHLVASKGILHTKPYAHIHMHTVAVRFSHIRTRPHLLQHA
eukprot:m.496279 g.496279  ORF g.496279 m.496279 type:complete len:333 (+) comp21809_c0_seq5:391-1389(+)